VSAAKQGFQVAHDGTVRTTRLWPGFAASLPIPSGPLLVVYREPFTVEDERILVPPGLYKVVTARRLAAG
jgi:hypothetical protein